MRNSLKANFEAAPARYCPLEQLATFTLLMAGHGRSVVTAMILGDREYAMLQLARAHTLDDEELRAVTVRLFEYFETKQLPSPLRVA